MAKLKMEQLNRVSVNEFKKQKKIPLIIVLDNIRSLNNIGSVFRTADAFSVSTVYLCGITGKPPHKEIHKTALGATESVDWKYFESTLEAIDFLKQNNFIIYAIEQVENSIMLDKYVPETETSTAFVFGNEVEGVDELVLDKVDGVIEIPQYGTKHSLNISVSAGILIWHYFYKLIK